MSHPTDVGAYRPFILPSPRILARMMARASEARVEEALRQVRACLDAEAIDEPCHADVLLELANG